MFTKFAFGSLLLASLLTVPSLADRCVQCDSASRCFPDGSCVSVVVCYQVPCTL